jgi:5,10-methylenetetrahydromethanopterin reductase
VTGYHGVWEWNAAGVDSMPGGVEWRARIEAERPEHERHLVVHQGHLVAITDRDRPNLDFAGPALLHTGWTGTTADIQGRMDAAGAAGINEVVFALAGDISEELQRIAAAAL